MISASNVIDSGHITINGTLTFGSDDTITSGSSSPSTIDNSAGTITVSSGAQVTLGNVVISGGTVNNTTVGTSPSTNGIVVTGTKAAFDDVILNNTGTITVSSGAILALDDGATVSGGTLSIALLGAVEIENNTNTNGATFDSAAITDGGTLTIASGATLSFDGTGNTIIGGSGSTVTVENSGTIALAASGSLVLNGIQISDGSTGQITVASGATLRVGSSDSGITVSGATFDSGTVNNNGTITVGTDASLTLQDGVKVVGGTINVNGSSTLFIENGSGNAGATLDGVNLQNSGTIQVDGSVLGGTPATVNLILTDGSVINGGTLSIGGSGGEVEIQHGSGLGPDYGATFDSGITVNNQGTITVDSGATLSLVGSTATTIIGTGSTAAQASGSQTHGGIANSGAFELGTTAASASLDIGAMVTLYGSGTLTLENGKDIVTGASGGGELFNYGTIAGAGSIDNSSGNGLTLTNEAGGVVDANVSGETLTLNTGNQIVNDGTLEATSGGILQLDDAVTNSGAGVIEVNGGTVEITSNANVAGDSVTFASAGGTLQLDASQSYTGKISGFGSGDVVDMTDFAYGPSMPTPQYTYASWNNTAGTLALTTVDGAGNIEASETINFAGTSYSQDSFALTADSKGETEMIADPTAVTVTGASNGSATVNQTVTVSLTDQALQNVTYTWLEGATVTSDTTASFTPSIGDVGAEIYALVSFTDPNNANQTDTITAFAGAVQPPPSDNWIGGASGEWSNPLNWSLGAVPNSNDDVTISGAVVTFDTSASPTTLFGLSTDDATTLDITSGMLTVTNSIQVLGPIDNGGTFLVPNGTVDLATNSGFVEITDGGTLFLPGSFNNANGDVEASGGSTIQLGNITVIGGTLTTATSADTISVEGTDTATLDNVTVNNAGNIQLDPGTVDLILTGGTVVSGSTLTIGLDAGEVEINGSATFDNLSVANGNLLQLDAGATLSIAGTVLLISTANGIPGGEVTLASGSVIAETAADEASSTIADLTNSSDYIEGAGQIGDGSGFLALSNGQGGDIDATISGQTLTLDTGDAIINIGALGGLYGATLVIDDRVSNNVNGDINAGSNSPATGTVIIENVVTNSSTATVNAYAGSTVELENGVITGGTVTTAAASDSLAAGVILATGTSEIDHATFTNNGTIEIGGTITFDDDIVNGGIITGANNNSHGSLNVDSGSTLALNGIAVDGTSGGGGGGDDSNVAPFNNAGAVTLGTTLTLGGNALTLEFNDGGTIALNGATVEANATGETLENNGNDISATVNSQIGDGTTTNLTLDNAAGTIEANRATITFETGNTIDNAGTLQADSAANSKLKFVDSAIDNTGNVQLDGTLVIDVPSTAATTLTLDGAGTVTLAGGAIVPATGSTGETLDNNGNNIVGYGSIGNYGSSGVTLVVNNEAGTIEASGGSLKFATGEPLTNGGLLEAATGGTLDVTIGMIANNGTAPLAASNPAGILVDGTFKVDNPTSSSADGSVTLGSSTGDPGGTLALAGGTIEGNSSNAETLKNADNTIEGYGSIGFGTDQLTLNNETNGTIDANVSGQTLTIDTGATVTNSGLMEAADGATLSIRDILDNSSSGIVLASSGTVVLDGTSISGSGTYAITGGGTIDVQSAVSPNVTFVGAGTLELAHSASYSGTISGFSAGDTLNLTDLTYASGDTAVWTQSSSSGGTLAINNSSGTQLESFQLAGSYTNSAEFTVSQGAGDTTDVTFNSLDYFGSVEFPSQPTLGARLQGGDIEQDNGRQRHGLRLRQRCRLPAPPAILPGLIPSRAMSPRSIRSSCRSLTAPRWSSRPRRPRSRPNRSFS